MATYGEIVEGGIIGGSSGLVDLIKTAIAAGGIKVVPVVANKCVGLQVLNLLDQVLTNEGLLHADTKKFFHHTCLKSNGTHRCTTWRKFKAKCPKVNFQCSGRSEAYVAAVTVCNQSLF